VPMQDDPDVVQVFWAGAAFFSPMVLLDVSECYAFHLHDFKLVSENVKGVASFALSPSSDSPRFSAIDHNFSELFFEGKFNFHSEFLPRAAPRFFVLQPSSK